VKTPRDILLRHHRSAQPKLDTIRHAVLAKETQPIDTRASLREALRSLRWHLAGMSAIWMLVLILHADTGHTPILAAATPKPPPPQVMLASIREHRRLLSEMTDTQPADSDRRELFFPKPRSERRTKTLLA
jgi:hypothetical protein